MLHAGLNFNSIAAVHIADPIRRHMGMRGEPIISRRPDPTPWTRMVHSNSGREYEVDNYTAYWVPSTSQL